MTEEQIEALQELDDAFYECEKLGFSFYAKGENIFAVFFNEYVRRHELHREIPEDVILSREIPPHQVGSSLLLCSISDI
jgi:hypothetical protein